LFQADRGGDVSSLPFSESLAKSLSLVELIGLSRRAILSAAPISRNDF
jgi:hypothetical protein